MTARTPDVQDGYRSPRAERMSQAEANGAKRAIAGSGFAVIPEGKRVLQFTHAKYRLQLTAPDEQKDSLGRITRRRAIVIVADEGFKVLDEKLDAFAIEMIFGDEAKGVEPHPSLGVDFWDFAKIIADVKVKKAAQAVEVLKDPEARALIIAALRESGEESFVLPEATGADNGRVATKPSDEE